MYNKETNKTNNDSKTKGYQQHGTDRDHLGGVKRIRRGRGNNNYAHNGGTLHSEILEINATSFTRAGGRNRRLFAFIVAGDKNGTISFGKGKSANLSDAIRTANTTAKKNPIKIDLNNNKLTHTTVGKSCATKIRLMPRNSGGLRCPRSVSKVLSVLGVEHATAKITGRSRSVANIISATRDCLSQQETNENYVKKLGITHGRLLARIRANLFRPKQGVK